MKKRPKLRLSKSKLRKAPTQDTEVGILENWYCPFYLSLQLSHWLATARVKRGLTQ